MYITCLAKQSSIGNDVNEVVKMIVTIRTYNTLDSIATYHIPRLNKPLSKDNKVRQPLIIH